MKLLIALLVVHPVSQDLSVAGKRAGLAGERSGLFMEQVRIVKEMRHATIDNRGLAKPRFMVWENVAGAFSSNGGKDFQAVLTEIIRIAEPEAPDVPLPEKGKWPHAGELHDEMGRWSIAYRLHDAQFWGVPQRRKRIALVADFQGGAAADILFEQYTGNEPRSEVQPESDSLSGDIKQSGAQRKDPAGTVRESTAETGGAITYGISAYDSNAMKSPNPNSGVYKADTARTLDNNGGSPACNQGGMAIIQGADLYNGALTGEASATVTAATGGTNTSGPKVMAIATKQLSQNIADNTANPLCANDYKEPQVVCLNDQGGSIMSTSENETATLRAQTHGHEPVVFENHAQDSRYRSLGDTCSTLASSLGTGGNNQPLVVKEPVCIGNGQADQTKESELVGALNCMHDQQAVMTFGLDRASYNQGKNAQFDFSVEEEKIAPQIAKGPGAVCAVDCRNGKESDINVTLQADADHNTNSNNVCRIEATVRRLTPLECERLQGFPDGWTDIGEWVDSKGKKHKPADAPRYKALGNSIALPFWFWLLRRISAQYTRQATLGSLFSGIGGFDLCWELCNGPGTSRFVSEIEPFCVALLKRRCGDDETGEKGDAWKYINP